MKKKISLMMVAFFIFSPFSTLAWNLVTPSSYHEVETVQARVGGYRSPIRSYRPGNNIIRKSPSYNQKTNSNSNTGATRSFFSGKRGLVSGILLGGFAGLLFGNFLPHMGIFGQFFGLITNLLVIFLLIRLVLFFFRRKRQPAAANGGQQGFAQQWQQSAQQAYSNEQPATATLVELDEDQLTNAMLTFYANRTQEPLESLTVQFLYDDVNGYGAEIARNGQLLERLDHFSMIQAIRYWAVEYGRLAANSDIQLHFSESQGVSATLTEEE